MPLLWPPGAGPPLWTPGSLPQHHVCPQMGGPQVFSMFTRTRKQGLNTNQPQEKTHSTSLLFNLSEVVT